MVISFDWFVVNDNWLMVNDGLLSNVVSGQSCNDWSVSWMIGNCVILRLNYRTLMSSGIVPTVIVSIVSMGWLLIMERSGNLSSIMFVSMLINCSVVYRDHLMVRVVALRAVMSTNLVPLFSPWLNLDMLHAMLLLILCAVVIVMLLRLVV